VIEVQDGRLEDYTVIPEQFGLSRHPADAVPGGDPQRNAEIAREIFAGETGAARDLAVLNAGAAIYAAGRAETFGEGVTRAQEAIEAGAAAQKLDEFVKLTNELSPR
jgi:anthranilate phosphoribosyltransferase